MTLDELINIIGRMPDRPPMTLTSQQRAILEVALGPLWVIAGPGSGKTETLVLRCLRLIYVDRVNPRSILATTFTEKAARELQDRLTVYAAWVAAKAPGTEDIDVTHVRVGTLHSICNDVLQESRYPAYQNVRLMDQVEQLIFINEHSALVQRRPTPGSAEADLWTQFSGILGGYPNMPATARMGWRINRAKAARDLVGRVVEYRVDINRMRAAGGIWTALADGYDDYVDQLQVLRRSDFSHVQATFLQFLNEPKGRLFIDGNGTEEQPGIRHMLVDEYQDTNPIQEAIYLELARPRPHNLMVVGDDDQAIYRFRGGTVESLINFNDACARAWGLSPAAVKPLPLYDNFRSHARIVDWCNHYITASAAMRKPGARAPGKQVLNALSSITTTYGDYPSVAVVTGPKVQDTARVFALTVRQMLDAAVVTDPSDCALLLPSTRETANWAGPYVDALRQRGVPVYNPRAKTFMEQDEVQVALGAFLAVVDPGLAGCPPQLRGTAGKPRLAQQWSAAFQRAAPSAPDLARYVDRAIGQIASKDARELLNVGAMELFYLLLAQEPFTTWQTDPARNARLAKLTSLLETYTAMPRPDQPERTRNWLATSTAGGSVSLTWRTGFYWSLVGILEQEDLDDREDEYQTVPHGYLPIMTIFQAKGLQFPFVFVATSPRNARSEPSGTHQAEDLLYPFRINPPPNPFSALDRAVQDDARLFYVAHSRAQYGLVILATFPQRDGDAPHLGPSGAAWLTARDAPDLTQLPVRR